MTETEKIYRHIYPNTLWGIISDFNTQYQDYKEFSETNPEDIGDSDKEDMKFWLTELKIALQIYKTRQRKHRSL